MAESSSKPRLVKIVLGFVFVFFSITVVCLAVGGSLYFQEQSKVKSYVKDLCRVRSSTYDIMRNCIEEGRRTVRYKKCFVALWQVEFGQNGTQKGTIRSHVEESYRQIEIKSEQYKVCSIKLFLFKNHLNRIQVGSSYPCWYDTNKSSQITWYGPTTYYSIILLIIGATAIPFAIVALIIFCRMRQPADL